MEAMRLLKAVVATQFPREAHYRGIEVVVYLSHQHREHPDTVDRKLCARVEVSVLLPHQMQSAATDSRRGHERQRTTHFENAVVVYRERETVRPVSMGRWRCDGGETVPQVCQLKGIG